MINPRWLELPLSRTNFHGPKGVRAIEVRLYHVRQNYLTMYITGAFQGKSLRVCSIGVGRFRILGGPRFRIFLGGLGGQGGGKVPAGT